MNLSDILIALIRAELCATELEPETVKAINKDNIDKLYNLAEHHDLAHFIGAIMKKYGISDISSDVKGKLEKQEMLAFFRYKRIEHEFITLSKLFEEAKIKFVPLKGSVIRKYYKNPWMRTSCDIDILVREEDFDTATELICDKLGYKKDGDKNYHDISLYSPSGVHLELHFNINEAMENIDSLLTQVWDYTAPKREGSYEYTLTPEFFVFHIIAHMSYHFVNGGCGIRPFMDFHLVRNSLEYNEAELVSLCESCQLKKFYSAVCDLTDVWFKKQPKNDVTDRMQNYLILGGVYGSVENKIAVAQTKKKGKVGYIFSRIFMPLPSLKKKYPILKKHPYLAPIYQIKRWITLPFGGRFKRSINEAKISNSVSKDMATASAMLMKDVGLYK